MSNVPFTTPFLNIYEEIQRHRHHLPHWQQGEAWQFVHSWKGYTAKEINKRLGRLGRLWEEDYWDRMIRSAEHWQASRRYILRNPVKLIAGTFILEDRDLRFF